MSWRVRIGLYAGVSRTGKAMKCNRSESEASLKTMCVLAFLLIIGGVEVNPGPTLDDVYSLVMESKVTMEGNFKEINEKISKVEKGLSERLAEHEKKIISLEEENAKLKENLQKLELKQDDLENRSRRDNLIFYGIKEEDTEGVESWDECRNKVLEVIRGTMGLENVREEDIARAHRLGHRRGKRPIIAKFNHFGVKEKVLSSRKNLKNSNIFINEDYSLRVRQERNFLLEEMKAAREGGSRATVSFNKLKIDNVWYSYSWEEDKIVEIGVRERPQDVVEGTARQLESRVVTRQLTKEKQGVETPARGIDKWLRQRKGETVSNNNPRGRGVRGGK